MDCSMTYNLYETCLSLKLGIFLTITISQLVPLQRCRCWLNTTWRKIVARLKSEGVWAGPNESGTETINNYNKPGENCVGDRCECVCVCCWFASISGAASGGAPCRRRYSAPLSPHHISTRLLTSNYLTQTNNFHIVLLGEAGMQHLWLLQGAPTVGAKTLWTLCVLSVYLTIQVLIASSILLADTQTNWIIGKIS